MAKISRCLTFSFKLLLIFLISLFIYKLISYHATQLIQTKNIYIVTPKNVKAFEVNINEIIKNYNTILLRNVESINTEWQLAEVTDNIAIISEGGCCETCEEKTIIECPTTNEPLFKIKDGAIATFCGLVILGCSYLNKPLVEVSGNSKLMMKDCSMSHLTGENDSFIKIKNSIAYFNNFHFGSNVNNGFSAIMIDNSDVEFYNSNLESNTVNGEVATSASIIRLSNKSKFMAKSCRFNKNRNLVSDSDYSLGGAIAAFYSRVSLFNITATKNQSRKKGGFFYGESCKSIKIANSELQQNTCDGQGGSFFLTNVTLNVRDSLFEENYSKGDGAIRVIDSELALDKVNFHKNSRPDEGISLGSAIVVQSGKITISECKFTEHVAYSASALYANDTKLIIINSEFTENTSPSGHGSVSINSGSAFITDTQFTRNQGIYGGALYLNNTNIAITKSLLSNNGASDSGGAIYVSYNTNLTVIESIMTFNKAIKFGGIIYLDGNSVVITRSIMSNNKAVISGDDAYLTDKNKIYIVKYSMNNNDLLNEINISND